MGGSWVGVRQLLGQSTCRVANEAKTVNDKSVERAKEAEHPLQQLASNN